MLLFAQLVELGRAEVHRLCRKCDSPTRAGLWWCNLGEQLRLVIHVLRLVVQCNPRGSLDMITCLGKLIASGVWEMVKETDMCSRLGVFELWVGHGSFTIEAFAWGGDGVV